MLYVYTGCMGSGKTARMLSVYDSYNIRKKILMKPYIDNRFSNSKVVSRNGMSFDAINIFNGDDIYNIGKDFEVIFIDEIQLLEPHKSIYESIKKLLYDGKTIYIACLDLNYKMEPFETSSKLMALADNVFKMSAKCSCGNVAKYTHKNGGTNNIIEIGDNDLYESLCINCYKLKNNNDNS